MENFVGKHTGAAMRTETPMLSQFQIAVGSRQRVFMAAKELGLSRIKRWDREGKREIGRTAILEGDYRYSFKEKGIWKNGTLRMLVFETGMGMSSAEIITREILGLASKKEWPMFPCPIIAQIRAGTAGGVNAYDSSGKGALLQPELKCGDIVLTKTNLANSTSFSQSLGYFHAADPARRGKGEEKFLERMGHLGAGFSKNGAFFTLDNSSLVLEEAQKASEGKRVNVYTGNTLVKDSLYAESYGDAMENLRLRDGVLASSMEGFMHQLLAARMWLENGANVLFGEVLAVIGALPGEGFPENKAQERKAALAERKTLVIAAETLARLYEKIKRVSQGYVDEAKNTKFAASRLE